MQLQPQLFHLQGYRFITDIEVSWRIVNPSHGQDEDILSAKGQDV